MRPKLLTALMALSAALVTLLLPQGPASHAQVASIALPAPGSTELLYDGCNNIAVTFPDGTASQTVVQAVTPAGAVDTLWRFNGPQNRFEGFSPLYPQASDLMSVDFLDAVWICMVEGLAVAPPPAQIIPPGPITICDPPAVASFTATPDTIPAGQSSTLAWGAVENTDTLTIDQGVGQVSGPVVVSPTVTTTYTLTATGCGGTATYQVTVTVNPPSANLEPTDLWIDWNDPTWPVLLTLEHKYGDPLTNATLDLTCTMERYPKGQVNVVPPDGQQTNSGQVSISIAWGFTTDVDTGFSGFDLTHHDYIVYCTITAVDFTDTSPLNSYLEVLS